MKIVVSLASEFLTALNSQQIYWYQVTQKFSGNVYQYSLKELKTLLWVLVQMGDDTENGKHGYH